ncbi:MAG: substrate-binding domain-containing protein [Thermomicrobiales bacterium]|nr:substrate-binding domain-containing protein [Thermomicrobiales bacterium]
MSADRLRLFMPGAFAGLPESLRQAFAMLHPGVDLEFHDFVPSGMLAQELLDGAGADIFVSANIRYMTDLWRAGRVPSPRLLAGNRLCIIVEPSYGQRVASLQDLLHPGLVLVTPQPQTDPCGQYIVQMWAAAGMEREIAAKQSSGELVHSRGSGDLPGFLVDGRAHAGVFYASEAKSLGSTVVEVAIPANLDAHERIAFAIGAVQNGQSGPSAVAGEFVAFMTGPAGQSLLVDHGFVAAESVDPELGEDWRR